MNFQPRIVWEPYVHPADELKEKISQAQLSNEFEGEIGVVSAEPLMLDSTSYSKLFTTWIVHLPIRLDKRLQALISAVDGVEIFEPQTAYRARITFGKAFFDCTNPDVQDVSHIKANINNIINNYEKKEDEYYARIVFNNGKTYEVSDDIQSDSIVEAAKLCKKLADMVSAEFSTNLRLEQ